MNVVATVRLDGGHRRIERLTRVDDVLAILIS